MIFQAPPLWLCGVGLCYDSLPSILPIPIGVNKENYGLFGWFLLQKAQLPAAPRHQPSALLVGIHMHAFEKVLGSKKRRVGRNRIFLAILYALGTVDCSFFPPGHLICSTSFQHFSATYKKSSWIQVSKDYQIPPASDSSNAFKAELGAQRKERGASTVSAFTLSCSLYGFFFNDEKKVRKHKK